VQATPETDMTAIALSTKIESTRDRVLISGILFTMEKYVRL